MKKCAERVRVGLETAIRLLDIAFYMTSRKAQRKVIRVTIGKRLMTMTNKETLSALILMRDNCVNKREYDDPMREIKKRALEAAIKAIDNQERMQRELKSLDGIAETCNKLEKALELAVHDSDTQGTDIWCHDCPYGDDELLNHCWECGVKYYKRKAGID